MLGSCSTGGGEEFTLDAVAWVLASVRSHLASIINVQNHYEFYRRVVSNFYKKMNI